MGLKFARGFSTLARFAALLAATTLASAEGARAESPYCADLRALIARAEADNSAARYRAAAARQRVEYGRLAARARSMGCDQQQFLFFGDPPPPQCAGLNARLNALRGSIAAYDRAGADDGQRQALAARYDAECRNAHFVTARAPRPRNFFEELFGLPPPDETTGLREVPVGPADEEFRDPLDDEKTDERPRGGSMAICVRSCDGGFFPVSYSARNSNLDDLNALCKALCPNAEAKLYTQSQWKGLDSAVSIDGQPYSDHPNALKFQKSYDPSCGCKPKDQSWAEALAEAERILAERNNKDEVVTAERAEQLSRPVPRGDPRAKKPEAQGAAVAPLGGLQDERLRGAVSPAEGAAGASEVYREVVGPDGVKRRVRVVAPTL